MSRFKKTTRAILLLFVCVVPALSQDQPVKQSISLGRDLYLEVARTQPVIRDKLMESRLRSFVEGKGLIQSVINEDRYRCSKCLVVQDRESLKYGINLRYYVFLRNQDEEVKALPGMKIQFRGQYLAYTPVDSSKKTYILDIVYESGTIVVEE